MRSSEDQKYQEMRTGPRPSNTNKYDSSDPDHGQTIEGSASMKISIKSKESALNTLLKGAGSPRS